MAEIFTPVNLKFLFNGLKLTMLIAGSSMLLSLIFGTILAIARNYGRGLIAAVATIYIELFRSTPNLLWILAIRFLVPIEPMYSGILSFTLFTSAVVAEILRGGFNAVGKGQFEAAYSQGFTFLQTLWYIIMPQCFKYSVPALLSQIITVVKDTAFLWTVSIEEFTGKGMILMGSFGTTAQVFTLFGFMALIYFVINFMLSIIVRGLQKKSLA